MPDVNAFTLVRADQVAPQPRPVIIDDEPDMTGIERDIGALVEAVKTLKEIVQKQERENDLLRKELHDFKAEIQNMLSEFRGGSKVIRFMGWAGAGLLGGLIATAAKWGPVLLAWLPR